MPPPTLPIIDISPFLTPSPRSASLAACASALASACHDTGFFYLTGHGVPASTTENILNLARRFFLESSDAEKAKIARRDPGDGDGDGARGYQKVGENVTMGKRDWHEGVDFYAEEAVGESEGKHEERKPPYALLQGRNLWPAHPEGLREAYEAYVEDMKRVGTAVVRAMGMALVLGGDEEEGEGEDVFVQHTRKSFWVMRMIGYPGLPSTNGTTKGTLRDAASTPSSDGPGAGSLSCGAHTDYGCLTLLLPDSTPGALQVLSKDGRWIAADPIPGAFVVNIGDMMERWTNGLWKSTVHRVVHRGERYRVSVPFFFEPDWDARVRPLRRCVEATGGEARCEEVAYGEHLINKVKSNFT